MKIVLYLRVSSERQAEKDLSIPAQQAELEKFSRQQDWTIVRVFVDEAESARSADRPAFQEMIALARSTPRPFEAILVWKLNRFARNREDAVIYKSLLRRQGVQVLSLNERFEASASGRLLEGIIETIDEFYSANLAGDVKRGMVAVCERGYMNGGSAPVGYRAVKVHEGSAVRRTLEIDPHYGPLIQDVVDLFLHGHGCKEIARQLNGAARFDPQGHAWTAQRLYLILKNVVYTGAAAFNVRPHKKALIANTHPVIVRRDAHPALIAPTVYARVQELLKSRNPRMQPPQRVSSVWLLSGLARCGLCGGSLHGVRCDHGRYAYYGCSNYLKRGDTVCAAPYVRASVLESIVYDAIHSHLLQPTLLNGLIAVTQADEAQRTSRRETAMQQLDRQVSDLRARLARHYQAIEEGHLTFEDVSPRVKELRAALAESEGQRVLIEAVENSPEPSSLTAAEILQGIVDIEAVLAEGTQAEQRMLLRGLIQAIRVEGKKKVSIDWHLDVPSFVVDMHVPVRRNMHIPKNQHRASGEHSLSSSQGFPQVFHSRPPVEKGVEKSVENAARNGKRTPEKADLAAALRFLKRLLGEEPSSHTPQSSPVKDAEMLADGL
jgi:site-specific DNA recombinase